MESRSPKLERKLKKAPHFHFRSTTRSDSNSKFNSSSSDLSSASTLSPLIIPRKQDPDSPSTSPALPAKYTKEIEEPNSTVPVLNYSSGFGLTRIKNLKIVEKTIKQCETLINELGIKNAKKPQAPMDKILKILDLLDKLAKLEIDAGRKGVDYSADVLFELRNFYEWISDPNNFTEKDKNELKEFIKNQTNPVHRSRLELLESIIENKFTPHILRNMIHQFRALFKVGKITDSPYHSISAEVQKNKPDEEHSEHNTSLCKNLQYLAECISKADKATSQITEKKSSSHSLFSSANNNNDNEKIVQAYLAREEVIHAAIFLLKNPDIKKDSIRTKLYQVISYFSELNQNLLKNSNYLKEKLEQEKKKIILTNKLITLINFDELAKIMSEADDSYDIESKSTEFESLKKQLERTGLTISNPKGKTNQLFIITDNSLEVSVVIRSRSPLLQEVDKGISADFLRVELTNSLGLGVFTPVFAFIKGPIDRTSVEESKTKHLPLTRYWCYEISAAVECVDLTEKYEPLFKKANLKEVENYLCTDIRKFNATFITDMGVMLNVKLKLEFYKRALADTKPTNILHNNATNTLVISDAKSLKSTKARDYYLLRYSLVDYSNTYFTNHTKRTDKDEKYTAMHEHEKKPVYFNLKILDRESLIFTFASLLLDPGNENIAFQPNTFLPNTPTQTMQISNVKKSSPHLFLKDKNNPLGEVMRILIKTMHIIVNGALPLESLKKVFEENRDLIEKETMILKKTTIICSPITEQHNKKGLAE